MKKRPRIVVAPAKAHAEQAADLYARVAPLMAGRPSVVQGNVIAMLLGSWLWGHRVLDGDGKMNIEATRKIRGDMMIITTHAGFAYAADRDQQALEAQDGSKDPKGKD